MAEEKKIKRFLLPLLLLLIGIGLMIYAFSYYNSLTVAASTRQLFYLGGFLSLIGLMSICFKTKRVFFFNIIFIFFLLWMVDFYSFWKLGMPAITKKEYVLPKLPPTHIAKHIGIVPYADSVLQEIKLNGPDTVFDVRYSIDSYCKRITPNADSLKNQHAVFFGCSIAYGFGLEDDQTFPYYFQEQSKTFNAYNFAYPGYGTNHMLARLDYHNLNDQIKEKKGVGIYVFFWDHLYRSIGTMHRYTDWMYMAPYYTKEDGQLVRKGNFTDGRAKLSEWYDWLSHRSIVQYLKLDFPLFLQEKHFDLVGEMIVSAKKKYQAQLGDNEFYVVFYPNYIKYTEEQFARWTKVLDEKKIKYIDLRTVLEYNESHTLNGDPHPNANTNQTLAKALWKQISDLEK